MPTRLIREGIIDSDRINELDWAAEVFYRRLLNKVDDHGLYDARPSVLRTSLYSLRVDRVREADCSRWLAMCEKAGLIVLYEADQKPYLKVLDTRWQMRSKPKYPEPSSVNRCEQLKTPVHLDVVVDVDDISLMGFDEFWDVYPRKVGKPNSIKAWKKLRPDSALVDLILKVIAATKWSDELKFIPYPATWLNDRRFEDQSEPSKVMSLVKRAAV